MKQEIIRLKTNWERKQGRVTYYIQLDHHQVIIGEHVGSGHSDNASACSYTDFLKGRFQDHILSYFDQDVLNDVITAVLVAPDYGPYVDKRNTIAAAYTILKNIPLNPALADLPTDPNTEKGSKNYGNAGGYKTIVSSSTLTMTVERDQGFLAPNTGGEVIPFQLSGHASHAVALQDMFFLVVSDDYAIINAKGVLLPKEYNIFGSFLRINTVFRRQDMVCFGYAWFHGSHQNGWLQYQCGEGFIGRWEKS